MHAVIVAQVYPGYNNDNQFTLAQSQQTNTITHSNPCSPKPNLTLPSTTQNYNTNTHKSDTQINQITRDYHFIKKAKHVPIEDLDITADDKIEPETKEVIESTEDLDETAVQYEHDVDLEGLVEINQRFTESSSVDLDELVQNNSPDDIKGRIKIVTSESFDHLAAPYKE